MDRLADFLAMGGYGAYVWAAYLIAAVVMLALLIGSLHSLRAQESRLAALRQSRRGPAEDDT